MVILYIEWVSKWIVTHKQVSWVVNEMAYEKPK